MNLLLDIIKQGEVGLRKPNNVSAVPHRSPFRYPGGKTWLVPYTRQWLRSLNPPTKSLVEPFAGGAMVSLSALFDGLTTDITLIEKDLAVGSVWQTIAGGGADELAQLIVDFELTEQNVLALFEAAAYTSDVVEKAFATIVRNRVQRGGILAPGASLVRNGENGKGLKSRWYPETLRNRLLDLHSYHSHIEFLSTDGIEYMKTSSENSELVWFIDPPYTVAARRLYVHSDIDHEALFEATSKLKGHFLMTYDKADDVIQLARKHSFELAEVAMRNTHNAVMTELLISRDLSWFNN